MEVYASCVIHIRMNDLTDEGLLKQVSDVRHSEKTGLSSPMGITEWLTVSTKCPLETLEKESASRGCFFHPASSESLSEYPARVGAGTNAPEPYPEERARPYLRSWVAWLLD